MFCFILILIPSVSFSQVGYKELTIGMTFNEVERFCKSGEVGSPWCPNYSGEPYPKVRVYPNLKSSELGLIMVTVGTYDVVFNDLLTSMKRKYKIDFHYTDQQLELYNSGKRKELYISFEKGQVVLSISRNQNINEVKVIYCSKERGKFFLEKNTPNSVKIDDF